MLEVLLGLYEATREAVTQGLTPKLEANMTGEKGNYFAKMARGRCIRSFPFEIRKVQIVRDLYLPLSLCKS